MRLKELREEREMTQQNVANGIHTSQRNIGRWENNDVLPSSDFIIKLADFFGVSADYLLGRTDDFGAIAPPSAVPALSAEEREILALYSNLDYMGKKLVRQTLETLNGGASSSVHKKGAQ